MKVLAKYKVLFAVRQLTFFMLQSIPYIYFELQVKSGGHAMNPFFSSTMGVQIYMCRLNKVEYNSKTQTVDIGAGGVWDEVYAEMTRRGRNIVGGASSSGVGVAGYLLGGGYSLKSNQYGLGIDNVTAMEVILPSGELHVVHEKHHAELFTALKVMPLHSSFIFSTKVSSSTIRRVVGITSES
jgi:FAD/FMN-containing dehydrogenase